MRSLLGLCFWALTMGSAVACAPEDALPLAADAPEPQAFLRLEPPPLAQPFSMELWLCDGTVTMIDATMPAHQHGMKYAPRLVALGDGAYRVEEMLFHMPGLWQISVTTDRATYHYDVTLP